MPSRPEPPPAGALPDAAPREPILRRIGVLAAGLGLILWASLAVWQGALARGLIQLEERGAADLRLASNRLVAALAAYREVVAMAAAHPYIVARAEGAAEPGDETVGAVLRRIADQAGARDLALLTPSGEVLASSGGVAPGARLDPSAADLARAAQGAAGAFHFVDPATGERLFRYAAPVFSRAGPVAGLLALSFAAERVEAPGRGDPVPVWFTDAAGVVFVANRSEMLFAAEPGALRPAPLIGVDLVTGGGYLPRYGLLLTRDLPVIEMVGHSMADAGPLLRLARAQALSVALALFGFGAVILALLERRRTLAERLAAEARAKAELEARVAARTAELSAANDLLTRTQAELVQAGKLSALGQMSAGISHELNQPLMAIRSFAENAELLLERGRVPEAAATLGRISDMARRMGRIIKNLRAFARAETEPATRVGLAAVVESALELLAPRLAAAGIALDWRRPEGPAVVMGGEVRLAQVVVNLIANAIDAMEGRALRRLTIRIRPEGARVRLTIRDTGPGIAEPERIFDPFYSTKEPGSGEGMGLGLSISYGLVQGFGGTLTGENPPGGGALFTLGLVAAPEIGGEGGAR